MKNPIGGKDESMLESESLINLNNLNLFETNAEVSKGRYDKKQLSQQTTPLGLLKDASMKSIVSNITTTNLTGKRKPYGLRK